MPERYLLFAGDRYYPAGGWMDYKMDFASVQSAYNSITGFNDEYDWWQVVDSEARVIVKRADKDLRSGDWEICE